MQYVALALTWGASILFISIGLEGLSPAQVVLGRMVSGALALVAVTVTTRQRPPDDPVAWAHLGVVSLLLCAAPFLLFAWAQREISSSLASTYNATTPLMTMSTQGQASTLVEEASCRWPGESWKPGSCSPRR